MPVKDSFIAATALAHDLAVVTFNRRDFDAAGCAYRRSGGRAWSLIPALGVDNL
jgi:hypothetical protein